MKILLTAPPGMGKSTIREKVVRGFDGKHYGIVAREVLDESGKRIGFTSINPSGQSQQFMFYTESPSAESIGGQFDVDIKAIDDFVVPELKKGMTDSSALIFVDEIGRAQAKSPLFLQTLRQIFAKIGRAS